MKKLSLTLLTSLLLAAALLYCTSPTEPVFDNPYDQESGAYIPTPDLNTAPVQPLATAAITGGVFETNFGRPVTRKGVCWSTSENPTIEDNCSDEGPGTQPFETLIEGLDVTTLYYVRAYAINDAGTIYGGQRSFTTRDGVAQILTSEPTHIRAFSVVTGGEINDDGGATITARGVCYSENPNPSHTDTCIASAQGIESFEIAIEELTYDTQYFVRAFAENSVGLVYGTQKSFSTRDGVPTVITTKPFEIGVTNAQTGGTITDDGGAEITEAGVCHVEGSGMPDFEDLCVSAYPDLNTFNTLLENLVNGEIYTVRAYAVTQLATAWGEHFHFIPFHTQIVEVTNPVTGRTWMDRNLGASHAATSSVDSQAYGDLYQWGRAADGHQKRNSPTTSTLSNTDQPGHGSFISTPNFPYDWRSPRNDNLWQGINGINNPCPSGYRLPTEAEWDAERSSWSSNHATGAFNSPLKLPVAGFRSLGSGSLINGGSSGLYWSASVIGSGARYLHFHSSDAGIHNNNRARGGSVRCIKD